MKFRWRDHLIFLQTVEKPKEGDVNGRGDQSSCTSVGATEPALEIRLDLEQVR